MSKLDHEQSHSAKLEVMIAKLQIEAVRQGKELLKEQKKGESKDKLI